VTALTAEAALLGCVMAGYPNPSELFDVVKPGDFESPHDEVLWSAAMEVVTSGRKPSPPEVLATLGNKKAARLPGGATYISDLYNGAPNPIEAPTHAKRVQAGAIRRRIFAAAQRVGQMTTEVEDVETLVDMARGEIEQAVHVSSTHQLLRFADVLPTVLDIAQNGEAMGVPTPWAGIDRLIYGLQPGKLVVVGARPGGGKSLFGTNVVLHAAARSGVPSLFCSIEMHSTELVRRLVSDFASVSISTMQTGTVSSSGWDSIEAKTNQMLSLPIILEENPVQTLSSIRSAIINTRREVEHVPIVVVDYLQILTPRDRRVGRHEQLGEITRGLKIIAREFSTCVVAMAQLNREAAKRDTKPTMADLRESGSIEADADVIILLHRPDPDGTLIEALIEKNRAGPRGVVNLELFGHMSRLGEAVWTPTHGL
jgi:replicative DNA helicase